MIINDTVIINHTVIINDRVRIDDAVEITVTVTDDYGSKLLGEAQEMTAS